MKKNKEEQQQQWGSDGVKWLRGPLIGKGTFGSVYLATLKKPRSRFSCFPSLMAVKSAEFSVSASIQREKQVFSNLHGCSYIVKCFGEEVTFNKTGNMFYNLLLEYASGGTLADLIAKKRNIGLPETEVKHYTRCVLKGLSYIHEQGYVHCDLKPGNILLVPRASNFVAKIGDFGSSRREILSKKKKLDPYLRGTTPYLAPEVVDNNFHGQPSDIWALGCIVLEMLTGKPAWDTKPESSREDVLLKIGYGHELPAIPSTISKECKEFLKGCLVRGAMFRFTAEMLLNHPFLDCEDDERVIVDLDETSDDEDVVRDDELSSASEYYSDTSSFTNGDP